MVISALYERAESNKRLQWVEELRAHDWGLAGKHGSEIRRMCEGLRESDTVYGRKVVHREPKRLEPKAATLPVASADGQPASRLVRS